MELSIINEGINRVETGNTVLVSGLYGKEFKYINNRYGIVKNIYIKIDKENTYHIADIELLDSRKIYSVNFDYIYNLKLKNKIENISQHIITIENPVIYYSKLKSLELYINICDELGQHMSICIDKDGKSHVLLFSGIN